MRKNDQILNVIIHNGRQKPLDVERMVEFDIKSIKEKFFPTRDIDSSTLFEQFGDWGVDFTNVHGWAEEIPDIDPRSARLFTIWAEDVNTGDVLGITRGFFILMPFTLSLPTMREYYSFQEEMTYYPMAIISSLRTTIKEERKLDFLLGKMREEISSNWKEVRKNTIKHLSQGSDLWKRYVFSFKEVIHFTFLCPSIDREMIDTLQRNNYHISGVMQLLSSSAPSYDEATIKHHLLSSQKVLKEVEKKKYS
ncbi:MAG: hypothetical protein ACFFAE_00760 [Candidatus Hodarchaeota archaeon]